MSRRSRSFSQAEAEAFVDAANPHQWLLTAVNLHDQAVALWRQRGRSQLTLHRPGHSPTTWDDTNRATYLLAAFAMENMLKAFLVYEDPTLVAGGRLGDIRTHDLPTLADRSTLLPYRTRDRWVFVALSEGSMSWARYPCGRDADDMQPEGQFTVRLWVKYLDMMAAYVRKMKRLLTKGWTGPFGEYGCWEFQD